MQEKAKKFPLTIIEVIVLIVMIPILFYYSGKFLFTFERSSIPGWFPWWLDWFTYWFMGYILNWLGDLLDKTWGLLFILGFDCLWLITMKIWPLKSLRIKIYMTSVVLTLSAVLLYGWFIANTFGKIR
jgi:hypothetical protein